MSDNQNSQKMFKSEYLGMGNSPAESDCVGSGIGCVLSDGTVHVERVVMIIRDYSKTLALEACYEERPCADPDRDTSDAYRASLAHAT
jgi:hypothetical protein